jgi:hypothetical protein
VAVVRHPARQHGEQQNEELLQLSQNILNLTSEVHQLTVATTAQHESLAGR